MQVLAMPPRKKRRVASHMMEEQSFQTVRHVLPKEWVIRHYTPDYGIDIMVEVFEALDESGKVAETLGEWFFAQVKCTNTTNLRHLPYVPAAMSKRHRFPSHPQKMARTTNPSKSTSSRTRLTRTFCLQSSHSEWPTPILLLLVTLDTDTVYFVCLNDLVDKCILHEDSEFFSKKTKTLHIPATNVVTQSEDALLPLRFFAKRQKLYAAFAKFSYQQHYVADMINCHSLRLDVIRVLTDRQHDNRNHVQDPSPGSNRYASSVLDHHQTLRPLDNHRHVEANKIRKRSRTRPRKTATVLRRDREVR